MPTPPIRRGPRGWRSQSGERRMTRPLALFARLALSAAFLSAVADRFGLYGPAGTAGVAWGDFTAFTAFTALINPWAPAGLVPALAWVATVAEVLLGVLLLVGLFTRAAALASAGLLVTFALAMATSLGLKAPLDYSVLSAAARTSAFI